MKKISLLVVLLTVCVSGIAQSDEINISASFSQSLELRIVGSANVNFTFASISDYQNGFPTYDDDDNTHVQFQISSSTNFQVDMSHTDFMDAAGNVLDARYFYFRLKYLNDVKDIGPRFTFTRGDNVPVSLPRSDVFALTYTTRTVLEPGPEGNAGSFEENYFEIQFGCGAGIMRNKFGLPSLLEANITPGVYTSTLTLTAVPVIL